MGGPTLELLKSRIYQLGAIHCGVAPAINANGFSKLVEWIEMGYAGQMDYFSRRLPAYEHPRGVMEGVRSIIVMAFPYPTHSDQHLKSALGGGSSALATSDDSVKAKPVNAGYGRLARYLGDGTDYHDRLHDKLRLVGREVMELNPGCRVRGVVDTAPLLEREFARLAGLGWQGKNTLLINKWTGSYFFLCCLLTDLELPYDMPHDSDHCGTCTRCLEACPTDAFAQPGVLDASRCISYLTIEHRGPIPLELRASMGDWLFGCDICQEVCPWNRKTETYPLGESMEWVERLPLEQLFELDEPAFRERFRHTPLWRAKRRGVLRNAAIVIGNQRDPRGLIPLAKGLQDSEPLVRGASAWAIGQIGGGTARQMLTNQAIHETDSTVMDELRAAMA